MDRTRNAMTANSARRSGTPSALLPSLSQSVMFVLLSAQISTSITMVPAFSLVLPMSPNVAKINSSLMVSVTDSAQDRQVNLIFFASVFAPLICTNVAIPFVSRLTSSAPNMWPIRQSPLTILLRSISARTHTVLALSIYRTRACSPSQSVIETKNEQAS